MPDDITKLTTRLFEVQQEWWDLAYDEDAPQQLGAPATATDVARVASRFGRPLPPSYTDFLLSHNGWSGFEGEANLLATSDYDEEWYADARELFQEAMEPKEDYFSLYIPIVLGPTTSLAAFLDPAEADESGEMPVVEVHDCKELYRHPDFSSFLSARIKTWEYLIDEQRNGDKPI